MLQLITFIINIFCKSGGGDLIKKYIYILLVFFLIGCTQVEEEEGKEVLVGYLTEEAAVNSALENIPAEVLQTKRMGNEFFIFYRILKEGAIGIFTVYKDEEDNKYYINYRARSIKANTIKGEIDSKLNGRLTAVMGKVPDDEPGEKVKIIGENSEIEIPVYDKYFVIFNYQDTFRTVEYIK